MTALTDILDWSADRPLWQRDALRRIVTTENLTQQDVSELLNICLSQQSINDPDKPAPEPEPLSADHIPEDIRQNETVRLTGLSEIEGVNALAHDQEMTFGSEGMTVIFGYNGSGKSGYARILKTLCRARHRGAQILPDAFSEEEQIPSANVAFKVGDADRQHHWERHADPPTELRQISFFDSDCATVHVDDFNELAFTPFGLDVLPKLANLCRGLSNEISQRITTGKQAKPASLQNPQAADGTQTRTALNALNSDSRFDEFQQLARLSNEDRQRITQLRETLSDNPGARARELGQTVNRLRRLQTKIARIETEFCDASVEDIHTRLEDFLTKRRAADVAAKRTFDSQPLTGVGSEIWYELWASARRFSEAQAYADQEFPYTDDQARCVLCLQKLSPDAQDRLRSFETFVKGDTHRVSEQAQQSLNESIESVRSTATGFSAFRDCSVDLRNGDAEPRQSIILFCKAARRIQRKILGSFKALEWHDTLQLPPTPDISTIIADLTERIRELEAAVRSDVRQAMLSELNELLARQWLSGILDDVAIEISRQQKLEALENARRDVGTTGITRRSSELTDRYVTEVLQERFIQEIQLLGANHLPVEFNSPGGQLGHKQFRINLVGLQRDVVLSDVLSEGEFRCMALAGFLTELSTEDSGSALIFDDPVSSMDHLWRRKVAERLADNAIERQVIVFTHDIVFLSDLLRFCKARDVEVTQSYLSRRPSQIGECMDGLPWPTMAVKKRIGYIKSQYQEAEATFRNDGPDAYEPRGRRIYGLLRETWERAVEEILLNGTVMRYDFAVHTQQLRDVHDISEEDVREIENGMSKTSRYLVGHDDPHAAADPIPNPDELRQDIDQINGWVKQIRQRRN